MLIFGDFLTCETPPTIYTFRRRKSYVDILKSYLRDSFKTNIHSHYNFFYSINQYFFDKNNYYLATGTHYLQRYIFFQCFLKLQTAI